MDPVQQSPSPQQVVLPPVPTEQPQQTVPAVVTPQVQPVQPISGPHKEYAPIPQALSSEVAVIPEVEPQLPPEVQEAGVEVVVNSEQPQLNAEHKAAGVDHSPAAMPHPVQPTATIQLPYTMAQAEHIEKEEPIEASKHWLAVFTEYLIKRLHGIS